MSEKKSSTLHSHQQHVMVVEIHRPHTEEKQSISAIARCMELARISMNVQFTPTSTSAKLKAPAGYQHIILCRYLAAVPGPPGTTRITRHPAPPETAPASVGQEIVVDGAACSR